MDHAKIFAGLYVCSADLPDLDNLALQVGVESLGGAWRRELTKECTHLIALTDSGDKYEAWLELGEELGMVCILPDWCGLLYRLGLCRN